MVADQNERIEISEAGGKKVRESVGGREGEVGRERERERACLYLLFVFLFFRI